MFESSRKAIVLGRDVVEAKNGDTIIDYKLKRGIQQRVDAMHRHWLGHQHEFTASSARMFQI